MKIKNQHVEYRPGRHIFSFLHIHAGRAYIHNFYQSDLKRLYLVYDPMVFFPFLDSTLGGAYIYIHIYI